MANMSHQALQAFFAPLPSQNWTRRAYHASAVVGDYIYIDAGELTVGSAPFDKANASRIMHQTFPINCTMVLPIGKGWQDPSTVQYQVIPKPGGPVYNFATFWHDVKSNSLYTFGGEQSLLDQDTHPLDLSIWRLDLDGNGGGNWVLNSSATDQPFRQGITRPIGGGTAFSNTTGFYAGGYMSKTSSPLNTDVTSYVPLPGIVEYSFSNGSWTNSTSTAGINPNGAFEWGGMEYLPTLGPNGMLVFWGGERSGLDGYSPGADERPMDVITLMDPVTKQYYQQNATGSIPPLRNRFCSVNVEDPRPVGTGGNSTGTWEIFMYSGWEGVKAPSPNSQNYDNVWVLSIPSFTWTNVYSSQRGGRYGHTCHVVGKRQMLSIGGVDAAAVDGWNSLDPFAPNSLAVFDLSKTQWTTGYDAEADSYQRPSQLEDYYTKQGPFPTSWTDGNLKHLLGGDKMTPPLALTSAFASVPTMVLPNAPQVSNTASSQASLNHTRMIVGATAGALAVFVLLPMLFFLISRYRGNGFFRIDPDPVVEMSGEDHRHELGDRTPHGYRSSSRWRDEKRGRSRGRSGPAVIVELDAGFDAVEKPTIMSRNSKNHDYYSADCKKPSDIAQPTLDDWDTESVDSEATSFGWPQQEMRRYSSTGEKGEAYPTVSSMDSRKEGSQQKSPSPINISPISQTQTQTAHDDRLMGLSPRRLKPAVIASNSNAGGGNEEEDMNNFGGAGMLGLRSPGLRWQRARASIVSDDSLDEILSSAYSQQSHSSSARYPSAAYTNPRPTRTTLNPFEEASRRSRTPNTGLRKLEQRVGQG